MSRSCISNFKIHIILSLLKNKSSSDSQVSKINVIKWHNKPVLISQSKNENKTKNVRLKRKLSRIQES